MTLGWCQNFVQYFVSPQYFKNKLIEFDQILYIFVDWYWQDLGFDFRKFITKLWPLINVRFSFPFNFCRKFNQILYMHWSTFRLLPVIFCKFVTELSPLIDVRFSLTKFCICICIDIDRLGLLPVIFRKFAAELWFLIEVDWMHTWPFNIQHGKLWGWAIVRFSDNSSFTSFFLNIPMKMELFGLRRGFVTLWIRHKISQ